MCRDVYNKLIKGRGNLPQDISGARKTDALVDIVTTQESDLSVASTDVLFTNNIFKLVTCNLISINFY